MYAFLFFHVDDMLLLVTVVRGSSMSAVDHPGPGDLPLPPGLNGHPIVENVFPVYRDHFGFYDSLADYGDVVRDRIGRTPFIALLHPDPIEEVLVCQPEWFRRWGFAESGLDFAPEGLFTVTGAQWRRQGQTMYSAFTVEKLQEFADTIWSYAADEVDGWEDGDVIDLNRIFEALTFRILTKTLLDIDVATSADSLPLMTVVETINELAGPQRIVTRHIPEWVPTPNRRRFSKSTRAYRRLVDQLIEERKQATEQPDDLLSILQTSTGPDGSDLSDVEVRDNFLNFMTAGYDTTALALAYTCKLLSNHPAVADRIADEMTDLGSEDARRPPGVDCLDETQRVLKESLRLYPPAFKIYRAATRETTIAGYHIPRDAVITMPQFRLHRDARWFTDPDVFRPDRWTEEFEKSLPKFSYFPFGGGPLHCVGMRFATIEIALVIAKVAATVRLEPVNDPEPDPSVGVSLQPAEPIRVRIHRR